LGACSWSKQLALLYLLLHTLVAANTNLKSEVEQSSKQHEHTDLTVSLSEGYGLSYHISDRFAAGSLVAANTKLKSEANASTSKKAH
jgi:hypothetical protein